MRIQYNLIDFKMQYSQLMVDITNIQFAPDSTLFAYSTNKNIIHVKQATPSLVPICAISVKEGIDSIAISPDSKYIAVLLKLKQVLKVYNIHTSAEIAKIEDSQHGIQSFFWVKDSIQIMVFSEFMYKASIYNLAQNNMCFIKGPKLHTSQGFTFTSDGKFMALLQKHDCKDYLSVYHTQSWEMVNSFQLELFDAVEVRWAPNNSYLIVWDNCINYRLQVLCHARGQVLKYEPYNFALGIRSVQYSPGSLFLAIGSYDEKIRLLNALTWQQIGILDCSQTAIDCEKVIVYKEEEINKNTEIKIYGDKKFKIPVQKVLSSDKGMPAQGISQLEFSDDESFIACKNANMPNTIWIWDVSRLEPFSIITCTTQIRSFKWAASSLSLSIVTGTKRVLFWSPKLVKDCSFDLSQSNLSIQNMKWSEDGNKLLVGDKRNYLYAEFTSEGIL